MIKNKKTPSSGRRISSEDGEKSQTSFSKERKSALSLKA